MKCKKCKAEMRRDPRFDEHRRYYTLKYGYHCPECGHIALKHRYRDTVEEV